MELKDLDYNNAVYVLRHYDSYTPEQVRCARKIVEKKLNEYLKEEKDDR